jgi:putative ABC transport system permease protein
MLSGNPVSVSESSYDLDALTTVMDMSTKQEIAKNPKEGTVYINSYIESLAKMGSATASMIVKNTITQDYIDYVQSMPTDYYSAMKISYGIDVLYSIFTDFSYTGRNGEAVTENMSIAAIQEVYTAVLGETDYADYASYISMYTDIFAQAPDNEDYILSQYDLVGGQVAKEKDELMIVLNSDSESTDLVLAQLGYLTQDQFLNFAYKAVDDEHYDPAYDVTEIPVDQILGKEFTWYPNDSLYYANEKSSNQYELLTSKFGNCDYIYRAYNDDNALENGLPLKVVGVLKPKATISYGCLSSGIYFTKGLAEYAISQNKNSEIVQYAEKNGGTMSSGYYTVSIDSSTTEFKIPMGVAYEYSYVYDNWQKGGIGFVGTSSSSGVLSSLISMMGGSFGSSVSFKTMTVRKLGGSEIANRIYIYPIDFDSKNLVTDYLDAWNNEHEEEQITYTDSLELVVNIINQMIDIITSALIAFTSISLVVSSVMIGVITYVSVVERTKEIGVLRSLGARKLDVSNLFNAETFIIGLLAGVVGVVITYLISIPVNLILGSIMGVYTLLSLPIGQAFLMICVSFVLTMISGLIPARAAAKKDPVIALRTE